MAASIFPNSVIISPALGAPSAPAPYFGWQVDLAAHVNATGPRMYAGTGDPNGVLTAPLGSIWQRSDSAGFYRNTDGSTAWTAV